MEDTVKNNLIRSYRQDGYSLSAIAIAFKRTRQRIRAICGPTGRPTVLRTVLVLPDGMLLPDGSLSESVRKRLEVQAQPQPAETDPRLPELTPVDEIARAMEREA